MWVALSYLKKLPYNKIILHAILVLLFLKALQAIFKLRIISKFLLLLKLRGLFEVHSKNIYILIG